MCSVSCRSWLERACQCPLQEFLIPLCLPLESFCTGLLRPGTEPVLSKEQGNRLERLGKGPGHEDKAADSSSYMGRDEVGEARWTPD